ncbi:hypothetical protein BJF93_20705 [Xaviernesmea oryzae]|uniref:PIN domain-containing protein n=1 Tax=Xaviernesmea oryzae TaxID=464029 RepID=A0A1Q9AZR3_9HYPH|nr:PIN domain-containing protein [Xaviernesmea oryzae]OLP61215.1 hypothetical protein BJF93_20705 [Xaviernesmea oryzae]SEL50611.1 PIN domain-containing protein [Xaviernesmea oryzae]
MDRAIRVLLDINIFVADIMAHDRGHQGTATQTLISMVSNHQWGMTHTAQLVISFEMIDTLAQVLRRQNFFPDRVRAYCDAVIDVMRYGPLALDPYLILGGAERLTLADGEDAGVLATALAAKVDVLVTDNLKDFVSKDAGLIETTLIRAGTAQQRQLYALRYEVGLAEVIIAHPFDVMQWMRLGYDFRPDRLWAEIARAAPSGAD